MWPESGLGGVLEKELGLKMISSFLSDVCGATDIHLYQAIDLGCQECEFQCKTSS